MALVSIRDKIFFQTIIAFEMPITPHKWIKVVGHLFTLAFIRQQQQRPHNSQGATLMLWMTKLLQQDNHYVSWSPRWVINLPQAQQIDLFRILSQIEKTQLPLLLLGWIITTTKWIQNYILIIGLIICFTHLQL